MAIELPVNKPGARDIQKLAREAAADQLDKALTLLRRPLHDARAQDEAVHEIRKQVKQVRALARLIRQGLSKTAFTAINTTLRDATRPLSEVRDATAILDALEKLPGRKSDIHEKLLAHRTEIRRKIIDEQLALPRARRAIEHVRRETPRWQIAGDWQTLAAGLSDAYRKARRAMHTASKSDADDTWHEWRKRTKDLRYQLEMLSPLWPATLCALADEAHTLTDLLGDDHDLALLLPLAPALTKPILARRQALRKSASTLGQKLFAEKPKAFLKRLHTYWQSPEPRHADAAAKGD